MECPGCRKENEATNRFCIFCGCALPPPGTQPAPAAEAPDAGRTLQLIRSLRDEVNQLRQYYQLIE